jgi:hypothetical protein
VPAPATKMEELAVCYWEQKKKKIKRKIYKKDPNLRYFFPFDRFSMPSQH